MSRRGKPVIYSSENTTDAMTNDFQVKVKQNGGVKNDSEHADDRASIALLVFLYVLQGIPLGLAGSIPMVLQGKHIGYKQQAMFSLVYWPFSLKLIWAPIVDAAYFAKFGRRKTWLVPMQYLIGFFMLFLAQYVNELLDDKSDKGPNVATLTAVFFLLNFFAATQDIAVDGWALTMLSRRNVGHASTCNSVGQTAGYFIGNVVFLALNSAEFSNKYFRSEPQDEGLVTLSGFLNFWGVVFLTTTTIVWLLKHEKPVQYTGKEDDVLRRGIIGTYKLAWKIVTLPVVVQLVIILVTCKIGFAGPDSVTGLKLIEAGVPKETLAMLAIPMIPIQIMLPLVISRFTAGPRALDVFLKAYPCRLFMGLVFAACVYWAHHVRPPGVHDYPIYFYATIVIVYAVHQVFLYAMFVSSMGFYAQISDPAIGGTYMTLLNTINNLGGSWTSTAALWFVDGLTKKECVGAGEPGLQCYSKDELLACEGSGGTCVILSDGYYIECITCVILGLIWLKVLGPRTRKLQDVDESAWKCT